MLAVGLGMVGAFTISFLIEPSGDAGTFFVTFGASAAIAGTGRLSGGGGGGFYPTCLGAYQAGIVRDELRRTRGRSIHFRLLVGHLLGRLRSVVRFVRVQGASFCVTVTPSSRIKCVFTRAF